MEGDVLDECKYKGGCNLKLNMSENITLRVMYLLLVLYFRSN